MAEHEQPKSSLHYMANIECRLDSIETPVHALVALYRPLISRCVKVDDIVFYLDDIIFTGNTLFFVGCQVKNQLRAFLKSVTCNENMIFELSPNLGKKLRENKINHFNKKFRNGLDFILNRRTRGNHRAKGKDRFNEGHETSLVFN